MARRRISDSKKQRGDPTPEDSSGENTRSKLPEDDALWAAAVSDVRPLGKGQAGTPRPKPRKTPQAPPQQPEDFAASLDGSSAFDLQQTGERFTGRAPDADRRLLRRLVAGQPPPESEIDLHGMLLESAEQALGRFLEIAWREDRRCVLVIHGSGNHAGGTGVIRRQMPVWLSSPPMSGRILCFATARPDQGGMGATMVLLRRGPHAPSRRRRL